MTATEIAHVRRTFRSLQPISEQTAGLFYARLFELDPSLRSLFHGEWSRQGRKLMEMLGQTAQLLGQPELFPVLRALGERHVGYGVKDAHYETVGTALLWTLRQALGPAFTPEVEAAWNAFYQLVASTMRGGAAKARAA